MERDPRHRYPTAFEMAWELEHPELVGVEEEGHRPQRLAGSSPGLRKVLVFAALALVPLALFILMLVLARR